MTKFFILFLYFLISASTFSQFQSDSSILNHRNEHIQMLLDSTSGYLSTEEILHFNSPEYFAVSDSFQIIATFKKDKGRWENLPTSGERTNRARRYGYVQFKFNDSLHQLAVYQIYSLMSDEETEDYLFLPFRDKTNNETTYGGGRFMDLKIPQTGQFVFLDFNLAYNPYCAYSHRYSCTLPPVENTLQIPITAGEKFVEQNHE
jgi:uncharacterized protein